MDAFNRNQNMPYTMERGIDLISIMRQVYIWMFPGMLLTTVIAFVTVSTSLINLASNPVVLLVAIVAKFGVVLGISAGFRRLSSGAATALFFVYAALNGFMLSILDMIVSIVGVLIFTALTAYDTQTINRMASQMSMAGRCPRNHANRSKKQNFTDQTQYAIKWLYFYPIQTTGYISTHHHEYLKPPSKVGRTQMQMR
jgi:FtsH-binding integral membrane protein